MERKRERGDFRVVKDRIIREIKSEMDVYEDSVLENFLCPI
jgi:hypothetical protein